MQVLVYKLLNSVQAAIGNLVYSDRSKKDLWEQFKMLDVFSFFFASYIGLGFWIFYQPFIQLWMGKEYLLSDFFVLLLSVTIYLLAVWEIVCKYRTVFGDYRQDRNFMLASAVLNLAVSIPGAEYFGIAGVQFGTLVGFLPIALGRIRFVVKNYFGQSMTKYLLRHMALLLLVLVEGGLCCLLVWDMPVSIAGIFLRGLVWMLMPLMVNVAVYYRNPYFKQMFGYMKKIGGWPFQR